MQRWRGSGGRVHLPVEFKGGAEGVGEQVVDLAQDGTQALQVARGQRAAAALLQNEEHVVHHARRQCVRAPLVYRDRLAHVLLQVELLLLWIMRTGLTSWHSVPGTY